MFKIRAGSSHSYFRELENKIVLWIQGNKVLYKKNCANYKALYKHSVIVLLYRYCKMFLFFQFSSVQWLSHVPLFATPWTTARQASLSITNSRSSLKLMSIESVMPFSHFILCHPLPLLPSILPNIRVFKWVSSSHQMAKVLEFQLQHQSFQWIFRIDFL